MMIGGTGWNEGPIAVNPFGRILTNNDGAPVRVREFVGLAVVNPRGVTHSTFRLENVIGISHGNVHDNDPREWVEDEM